MSEKFEKLFEKYSNMDKPTRIAYAKVAASKLLTYLYKEVDLSKQESILIAFSIISLSLSPQKGGFPHNKIKRRTPQLHTSHFSL